MGAGTTGVLAGPLTLQLLGGFCLRRRGDVVRVPPSSQRVLAMAALAAPAAVARATVRATLWPDADERQARASLRTALWRLGSSCPGVLDVDEQRVTLAPEVDLDLATPPDPATGAGSAELLPGWYDEWLAPERERIRQARLRLHEEAAHRALADGRTGDAIDLALRAVALEPLRESAHRILIAAHLQEGNVVEALLQFQRCCRLLADELGVGPSRALRDLIGNTRPRVRDAVVTA